MQQGYDGWGVAPSLSPQKAGARVQTDRRDTMQLARLARSGARTAVEVPTGEEEAMRALTRARQDTLSDLQEAQVRRKAFVLRHDRRYTGRTHGGPAHLRWRSEVVCPIPAQPIVCQADVRAVQEHTARLQRLAPALHEHGTAWRLSPVVEALPALRGVQCTVAVPLVAAMGDVTRFDSPRALMQCLGVMPSAYSSGEQRRQGSMTQAGHTHARRVLGAGAWAYRYPAKVSRHVHLRREKQPKVIQDLRGQAPVRLCQRYRRLGARGHHAQVVTGARARALTGFRWALAKEVPSGA
jgi:transposase